MTSKLAKIRDLMIKHSIQGYIVPSGDAHMSEYVAPCDERRAFISEFNGSAGTAFITLKDAYLWTDGRYWLQAQKQLDESWTLKKEGIDLPLTKFLTNDNVHAVDGKFTIGFDPYLYSVDEYKNMAKALADAYRVEFSLKSIPVNLVDEVWGDARPAAPNGKIFRLDDSFSGKSATEKIEEIRNAIIEEGCRNSILTALDEIAWLLNLRGSDINYNPVFFAYLIINDVDVILFVDKSKFEDGVEEYLHSINVTVKPYTDYLETLGQIVNDKYSTEYLIDPKSCNYASFEVLKGSYSTTITEKKSVVTIAKSFKNPVEIKGFRDCHIRDGASIVRYFAWVENELKQGHTINEYDGAVKLEEIRKQNDLFLGLSFSTISAYGKSASIIHYSPSKENSQVIGTDTLYLLDSGAHYKDGTTDTTRTVHFGTPSEEEKLCYTRVLQGHIAIDSLVFPEGVSGLRLDAVARTFLWKDGLDYNHGTGHGVGHALCVHEGPHGIGYRSITYNDFGLKENIIVTNEPGYYEPGRFGIRIENILLAKEVPTKKNFNDKKYIGFEAMTCCPIQPTICEPSLMSDAEISWLNNYNKRVRETLTPLLASDTLALDYLNRATQPLVH